MKTTVKRPASRLTIGLNKTKTFFSKPYNVILLLMGIVFTVTTIAPIVAIVQDTLKIHPGTIDAHLTGQVSGYTLVNYIDLFTSRMAKTNLWMPLLNTVLLAVGTCIVSILFGGIVAPLTGLGDMIRSMTTLVLLCSVICLGLYLCSRRWNYSAPEN